MKRRVKNLLAVAVVYSAFLIFAYNFFLIIEHEVHIAGDNVETAIERRHDLLGNAVATVIEYRDIEKKIMKYASVKRGKVGGINMKGADEGLTALLLRLSLLYEKYPDIKSAGPHKFLMGIIFDSEARVTEVRLEYNRKVLMYNLHLKTFPRKILARILGFHEINFFSADEVAYNVPDLRDLKATRGI
jgi:LemA protein